MKILIVLPRFPYPLEKGDKLRAYNQIRTLHKEGHDIYLFCLSHRNVKPEEIKNLEQYCKEINVVKLNKTIGAKNAASHFLGKKSLQLGYWKSRNALKEYRAYEEKVKPDVIYSQMIRTMPLVFMSKVPKVMDFQDALSLNMLRRMMSTRKGVKRFVYHFEFKMLRSIEYSAFNHFDALTIISYPDSQAIPHKNNDDIHIIPNGVDMDYFKPIDCEKDYDVVFCGNMQYAPNIKASTFLAEKVMPIVWQSLPQARLLIAGATPKNSILKLANNKITIKGSVEDIRECYASAKVFAAPMQIGSGLQNKLLEAMAMNIPCVTTSLANNALSATPDKEVLVGDTAEEIAQHIVELLKSETRRNELALNGHRYVTEHYSWDVFGQQLSKILMDTVASKKK